jgi:hypothetical protein
MTEQGVPYEIPPDRCHCDADWRIDQDESGLLIRCAQCGEWITTFEAVTRWNALRAEIKQLRLWAAAWKVSAKKERERRIEWYREWKYTTEQWAKEPSAVVDWAQEWMEKVEQSKTDLRAAQDRIVALEQERDIFGEDNQRLRGELAGHSDSIG